MMWAKLFYYLRIWNSTNYLARMIQQVGKDMANFMIIFLIIHAMFGQCFIFISLVTPEKFKHVTTLAGGFRASWMASLGEFPFEKFDHEDNPMRYLTWALLLIDLSVTMIVTFNLLISIVSETYEVVRSHKIEYQF
jgi:hypothetical protein